MGQDFLDIQYTREQSHACHWLYTLAMTYKESAGNFVYKRMMDGMLNFLKSVPSFCPGFSDQKSLNFGTQVPSNLTNVFARHRDKYTIKLRSTMLAK